MANMQEVAARLRELEKDGRLMPADVVDAARDPNSPLHEFFEWNDDEAAKQHRLGQARQLIKRVKIEVTVHDVPLTVARYVRDNTDGPDSYRDITLVRNEVDAARATIIDEMARVAKAARRAKAVAAVLGDVADIERIAQIADSVIQRASIADQPGGEA